MKKIRVYLDNVPSSYFEWLEDGQKVVFGNVYTTAPFEVGLIDGRDVLFTPRFPVTFQCGEDELNALTNLLSSVKQYSYPE